jgi:uncharacterized Ntn-hydrolase superfamily protein
MTYSIVARDRRTGLLGVGVTASSPAVAARCACARAVEGAVATQNVTDPALGPRALDLMQQGASAIEALEIIRGHHSHIAYRQLLAVDAEGRSAVLTGEKGLGTIGEARAKDVACAGNLLASARVPEAMATAFREAAGPLGDRLVAAMRAGRDAGGEAGPIHSAGMKLVRDLPWPIADLRIDWTDDDPIEALAALWARYAPQLEGYVTRALDPTAAPSYGVPGDA